MNMLLLSLSIAAIVGLTSCVQMDSSVAPGSEEDSVRSGPYSRFGVTSEANLPPSSVELGSPTQIIVLGSGTPLPDELRVGPGIAVIFRGESYIFDLGGGVVHNAVRARYLYDIPALYPSSIRAVFFTHLHSDHTVDYAELAATLWWRRTEKLRAFGPRGLVRMTNGMYEMMATDIEIRTSGNQPIAHPDFYQIDVKEIEAGTVLHEDGLVVEAFDVSHGDIQPAFGYRITTPDKVIVISGDTTFSETLIENATGVDLLFHEVISESGLSRLPEFWQTYHGTSHTSTSQVAEVARRTNPGKLILYHGLYYGAPENSVIEEVRKSYRGSIQLANDLDRY